MSLKQSLFVMGMLASIGLQSMAWSETATTAPSNAALFPPLQLGASSQEIPKGAKLKISFLTPLDSQTSTAGQPFVALTSEDLWRDQELILPKGTVVRGRVETAKKAGFFSKGGLMRLTFDHVQMPSGEIKPLHLAVDTSNAIVDRSRNALYTDPGVNAKLNNSVDKGVSEYKELHQKGIDAGKKMGGGANMLLTVPTTTIAGVAKGTAVTTVEATKAVFGKGETVTIHPGDGLVLDFSQSTQIQGQ